MHANAEVIHRFYTSLGDRDASGMAACYHPAVTFSDEVFTYLEGERAAGMWKMLCDRGTDLRIEFRDIEADDSTGRAHWEAWYTFSATRRPVHNKIEAVFEFRDGKIIRHRDIFDFWAWASQALGPMGSLLGWSGFVKNRVRSKAAKSLDTFLRQRGAWVFATVAFIGLLSACAIQPARLPAAVTTQDAFWAALQATCGKAYAGRVVEGNASDSAFRRSELRMHVRSCTPTEIRIPFHLGENRSRTWVITRIETGLRLKHDHRHEDGSEDPVTQYGGDTRDGGTNTKQEFHADAHTATLIPAARTNIWTVEIMPGDRFAYALRREGTDRRFRVEFDLTNPVEAPPPPWGAR